MYRMIRNFIFGILCLFGFISKSGAQDTLAVDTSKNIKTNYIISVVMPFCSKQILADPKTKNAALGNACRQYYEGFKLALDSINKADFSIEIRVFDSEGDSNVFKKILNKKEFQESNLVFGPVGTQNTERIREFCERFHVYNISPFLTLTKTKTNNAYLISAYPDLSYYGDFILDQIKSGGWNDANIVVFTGKDANEKVIGARMLALKNKYSGFSIKTMDINKYADYKYAYKPDRPNHVVIDSDNEFLVNSVIKFIADTNQFNDFITYGSIKWFDFKSFNLALWQQVNLNIICPVYIDYNDPKVKSFIERYREHYYTEPAEFALNGYEQGTYFINYLLTNNGNMDKITEQIRVKPLCNWFKISPKAEGKGYQNTRLNMLYFEESQLKRWE